MRPWRYHAVWPDFPRSGDPPELLNDAQPVHAGIRPLRLTHWSSARSVVVHIGCGLDSRFERVAARDSRVEWYDLDLPEVIALRRELLGDAGGRYHLLACSVLDDAWLETVSVQRPRPILLLAETVFVYFAEAQAKALVLKLRDRFPGGRVSTAGGPSRSGWATDSRRLAVRA